MTNETINKICKLIILSGGILAIAACGNESGDAPDSAPDSAAIHDRVLTLDSHVDISPDYTFLPEFDPGKMTKMKVDLPKMRAGGLDGAFFIVYVGQTARTEENYAAAKQAALRKFTAIHRMTDELYPDQIGLAYGPDDVRRIYKDGRKVAIIGIENGYVIGKDISLVEDYYNRGARYMTLAHNGHNDICDSAQPKKELGDGPAEHGGVSGFGRQVIGEMNRVGMMVDISHVSVDCMTQAVNMSQAPVIASHSGVRALADHPRNLTDEQLKLLAQKGGVIQLVAYTGYVKVDPARSAAFETLMADIADRHGLPKGDFENIAKTPEWTQGMADINVQFPLANVRNFIDQVDYAVKVAGIDHVGISSDFDGGGGIIGWNDASESLNITRELVTRGYSEQDIAKIWGGNLLRVWAEADRVATQLQAE
ncbi:MAG: membrane dipeptidase [Alphaproteobacteria bacterium]|nr:membrane dipeptidase [Alphaproteobacteria bacterium]